ncbi:hypothetical protein CLAFUW4_10019 [Fulvia fulva]|nr:hypothetical protein CLAFUR4_10023 [Fulvia fulva]KAK4616937.1 hypothetical protein CLAFUR0_10021 [Fulvia fulva]WPV19432.1 hypothetical protein CLAFUW4_10019 [Fulvia fulva]WPV34619.1 hypothetical protein CLAFUW7_10020 [Fulvia fulva]
MISNIFLSAFIVPAYTNNLSFSSLADLWGGELAPYQNRTYVPDQRPGKFDGGQCCLVALHQSLQINDDTLEYAPGQTALRGDLGIIVDSPNPCTAGYNGSSGGDPQVWITYDWCVENCGSSWVMPRLSSAGVQDWLQPMVGYMLSSVIFCLNIARRRRIRVPERLFPKRLSSIGGICSSIYQIPLASAVVTIDTITWLAIIFPMAGPMILAGIVEGLLDIRILGVLHDGSDRLTTRQRAHMLYCALLGDLDISPAWERSVERVAHLPHLFRNRSSSATVLAIQAHRKSTRHTSMSPTAGRKPSSRANTVVSSWSEASQVTQRGIDDTKNQLRCMLQSQNSFGSTVGAAVLFYTGSFVYALNDLRKTSGYGGTAHGLAFGVFWMTIPHVSIVSSFLLAGDNTKVWEAATYGHRRRSRMSQVQYPSAPRRTSSAPNLQRHAGLLQDEGPFDNLQYKIYEAVSDSSHRQAWLWDRGGSKAVWLKQMAQEYPELESACNRILRLGWTGWALQVLSATMILILFPCLAGMMLSYSMPATGLSCRSMTTLVYGSSQTLLIGLWLFDWAVWKTRAGVYRTLFSIPSLEAKNMVRWMWYALLWLGAVTAFFTSIMGTGMCS